MGTKCANSTGSSTAIRLWSRQGKRTGKRKTRKQVKISKSRASKSGVRTEIKRLSKSTSDLRIGTWNLCLGLQNKKDTVTRVLKENNIKICGLQETEIPRGYPEKLLNCDDYNLVLEKCKHKKRVGFYIRKGMDYVRQNEMERDDCHVIKEHELRSYKMLKLVLLVFSLNLQL